jgi:hypothetical protein
MLDIFDADQAMRIVVLVLEEVFDTSSIPSFSV